MTRRGVAVPVRLDPSGRAGPTPGQARGPRWFSGLGPDARTPRPVPVALGDRRLVRPRPGVRLCEDWLFDDDLTSLDGLPMTVAERSVTYEVRRASSLVGAVQAIDMAAYDDLVDVASLADFARRLGSRPGAKRLRLALSSGPRRTPGLLRRWRCGCAGAAR